MFFKKKKKPDTPTSTASTQGKPVSPTADFFSSKPQPQPQSQPSVAAPPAPAEPKSQPVAATQQAADAAAITITDLSQLVTPTGRPTRGSVVGDWYAFAPNQLGISTEAVPVNEGDEFVATATIAALETGQADASAQFGFGPVFCNAEGNIVRWFKQFEQPGQNPVELASAGRAPAGAVSVKLAIRGPKTEQTEGVYTIGARNLRLQKSV